MELPRRFYAIEEDGLTYYEITQQFMGPSLSILEPLVKFVPRVLYGVLDNETTLAFTADTISIARPIQTLALHTFFRPVKDKESDKMFLVPVFQHPGSEMEFVWQIPNMMELFVILNWQTQGNVVDVIPNVYLVARNQATFRTYLLPLPNLYEDARVCMGRDHVMAELVGHSAIEQLDLAIKKLQASKWNTDLLRQISVQAETLFRFDPDGKQIPYEGDWTALCFPVNHHAYQFLGKA